MTKNILCELCEIFLVFVVNFFKPGKKMVDALAVWRLTFLLREKKYSRKDAEAQSFFFDKKLIPGNPYFFFAA